jgi:hypothetical protein
MALLRSVAAYQPFRRAMPARPDNGATLRFLLQDDAFPRAVSSCLSELRATVKRLPDNEEVLAACTDASVLVADAPVDRLTPAELQIPGRRSPECPRCHPRAPRRHLLPFPDGHGPGVARRRWA